MRKETSGGAQALPDRSPSVVARSPHMDMASQPAPRARGVSAMLRRSLSFMLTGLLIAVPLLLTAYAAQTDWTPHNREPEAILIRRCVAAQNDSRQRSNDERVHAAAALQIRKFSARAITSSRGQASSRF
jgi:hypothetical protein